ncbi:MAG TPA: DUF1360 domain-containing protein [Chloroflexia bacterium]|nr:DUF1360 domain-containing protein [Chloroflexia bacterium]
MSVNLDENKERRATYITLISLFTSALAVFSLTKGKKFNLRPFDLALLGLSTFRLGHLVAFDKVTEPIRKPFTETKDDPKGAGKIVVSKGSGARKALGELLSCPICAGTWIAAGLVYGLHIIPGPTRVVLAIMSSVGLAEWLNSASEAMKWTGQARRQEAASH